MRNLNKFVCLMLALAMLLTSTVALAEDAAEPSELIMQTITLGDVQLSMNDASILDLSGLSLSMGGAVDPETGKGAAQLSVLGGDEAAASAHAAWDSSKAVLNVDGLSKPLTLDVEALMAQMLSEENLQALMDQLTAEMTEEEAAAFKEMLEALSEMFSEENLNLTMEGFNTYMTTVQEITEGCKSEPVSEKHTFAQIGEADAQHVTVTITEKEMSEIMKAALAVYDSNPAFLKLMNAALKMDGEDVQIASFAELGDEMELNDIAMNADVFVTEDGSNMEMTMHILEADVETGTVEMTLYQEGSNLVADMTISVTEGDEHADVKFNLSAVDSEQFPGEQEISATMDVSDDDDPASISLWYGPDETFGHMGTLNIVADGETVGAAIANSDTQKIFTIYDDVTSFEMGYVSQSQGDEAGEGMLYFSMDDGTDKYVLSAAVHTTTSTISASEIDEMLAVEGIDMMTISEDDISTLTNETLMVVMEAMGVLGQNVPGLGELMGTAMTETETDE